MARRMLDDTALQQIGQAMNLRRNPA